MPGNTLPIFPKSGDVTNNASTGMNQPVLLAANDFTGAGANNSLVFTADATNGSVLRRLRFKAAGSNVATVARIFINNGSTNATATNNSMYGEFVLPVSNASASALTSPDYDYDLADLVLPAGFRVYVGLGTAVASGWIVTPVAGKF